MNSWKKALAKESPLQIIGTANAYSALLAQKAGFHALYLSGSGICSESLGIPDIGLITPEDVLIDTKRICDRVKLPLLVDIDTGWGKQLTNVLNQLQTLGAAAIQIEDQVSSKRCGHHLDKTLVNTATMCRRLATARKAEKLYLIARTDAITVEGIDKAIKRTQSYRTTGIDALFVEAANHLSDYTRFKEATDLPILANMTEFGITPLYSLNELKKAGVDMVLYPLSAVRMIHLVTKECYQTIRQSGHQKDLIQKMQTRQEHYNVLDYKSFIKKYKLITTGVNGVGPDY